jgi:hypothetical protein
MTVCFSKLAEEDHRRTNTELEEHSTPLNPNSQTFSLWVLNRMYQELQCMVLTTSSLRLSVSLGSRWSAPVTSVVTRVSCRRPDGGSVAHPSGPVY